MQGYFPLVITLRVSLFQHSEHLLADFFSFALIKIRNLRKSCVSPSYSLLGHPDSPLNSLFSEWKREYREVLRKSIFESLKRS